MEEKALEVYKVSYFCATNTKTKIFKFLPWFDRTGHVYLIQRMQNLYENGLVLGINDSLFLKQNLCCLKLEFVIIYRWKYWYWQKQYDRIKSIGATECKLRFHWVNHSAENSCLHLKSFVSVFSIGNLK